MSAGGIAPPGSTSMDFRNWKLKHLMGIVGSLYSTQAKEEVTQAHGPQEPGAAAPQMVSAEGYACHPEARAGLTLNPPFPKVRANATVGTPSKQDHRGFRLPRNEARFALNRKSPPSRGERVWNGPWKKK